MIVNVEIISTLKLNSIVGKYAVEAKYQELSS